MKIRTYTKHFNNILNEQEATELYFDLSDNIVWEEGVRSRKGFTRFGNICDITNIPTGVTNALNNLLATHYNVEGVCIRGVYYNYYVNGDCWCPSHTHKGTAQIILSLGTSRTLNIGKKQFTMSNGDMCIFGSSAHGIQKEVVDTNNIFGGGRISVAFFVDPF